MLEYIIWLIIITARVLTIMFIAALFVILANGVKDALNDLSSR